MQTTGATRKLAAILAADVVGYSRMMAADEAATLAALRGVLAEVITPQLAAYKGRLVKLMGDGVLAEFASVVDAVTCAAAIQTAMATHQQDIPQAARIRLRIGVNLGDIILQGDDIFGDGVNLAARLEGLAEPGGICVSRTVANHVGAKAGVAFQSMGTHKLKNIPEPVEAFRVVATGTAPVRNLSAYRRLIPALIVALSVAVSAAWWLDRPDFTPADPQKMAVALPNGPSIAVLPFDYLGPDKATNDYIADGLSENIISYLARIPDLLVIARNSTFTYKDKAVDVRTVSETFGVRHILEGSVQLSGDTLRITTQLVDGVDGKHIWAETYDRPATDIFAVQDEITLAVARAISARTITGADIGATRGSGNLAAEAAMLQGWEQQRNFSPNGLRQAAVLFEKAIALDPDSPRGYASLALNHAFEARFGYTPDRAESARQALVTADKALTLDPLNSVAFIARAKAHMILRQPEQALTAALKASEVGPSLGEAIAFTGWVLKYSGRAEQSLPYFARARRIFVFTPWWIVVEEYGALIDAGKFQAASDIAEDMIARGPPFARADWIAYSALAHAGLGDEPEARRRVAEALQLDPEFSISRFHRWGGAIYLDPQLLERGHYSVFRRLGVPD